MTHELRIGGKTSKDTGPFVGTDATILAADVVQSRHPRAVRGGGTAPAFQLQVEYALDDGTSTRVWYGGVYPNEDGSVGLGQNGHAAKFVLALQSAGIQFNGLEGIPGLRVNLGTFPAMNPSTGEVTNKLIPKAAATTPTPPEITARVRPAAVRTGAPAQTAAPAPPALPAARPNLAALQPKAPAVDGGALFNGLDAETQKTVRDFLGSNGAPATLVQAGVVKTVAEAEAIAAHVKAGK